MKQALNITLGMGMLWLSAGYAEAQQVELLKPKELGRWNIPPGNYSGITPIGDGCYAVVSDKEAQDGFFVFRIRQDERTGQVTEVVNEGFRGTDSALKSGRDEEGVAFVPEDSLVWISGEADVLWPIGWTAHRYTANWLFLRHWGGRPLRRIMVSKLWVTTVRPNFSGP